MPDPYVVVLGDLNVDLTLDLPDRSAPAAERVVREPRLTGGGTAGNTAAALARLGVPVEFAGSVGDDGFGRWLADDLRAAGVGTRGLVVTRDAPTCQVIAMVEPDGERYLVVWPLDGGALTRLAPADVDRGLIAGAAWLHTTGMCLRAAPVASSVLAAMRIARDAGVPVSIDLNLRLELWGLDDAVLAAVAEAVVAGRRRAGQRPRGAGAAGAGVPGSRSTESRRRRRRWRVARGRSSGGWAPRVRSRCSPAGEVVVAPGSRPSCATRSAPGTRSTAGSSRRGSPGCRSPRRCAGATPWARSRWPGTAARGTSRRGRRWRRCWPRADAPATG